MSSTPSVFILSFLPTQSQHLILDPLPRTHDLLNEVFLILIVLCIHLQYQLSYSNISTQCLQSSTVDSEQNTQHQPDTRYNVPWRPHMRPIHSHKGIGRCLFMPHLPAIRAVAHSKLCSLVIVPKEHPFCLRIRIHRQRDLTKPHQKVHETSISNQSECAHIDAQPIKMGLCQ